MNTTIHNESRLRRYRRLLKRELWRIPTRLAARVGIFPMYADALWLHLATTGRVPNLARPRTFNEKILVKAIRDRRDYIVRTSDKIAVREYVADRVGAQVLAEAYFVGPNLDDAPLAQLKVPYVVKAAHGCGARFLRLVPDPSQVDPADLRALSRRWQGQAYRPSHYEWWYRRIAPGTLVEEFLGSEDGSTPDDYKFFVINGEVRLIQVDSGRFGDHRREFFSPDWLPLDISKGCQLPKTRAARPPALQEAKRVAEALARGTSFVRVDLYMAGERIVFGELTHCPGGGRQPFSDASWDSALAAGWSPPAIGRRA